MEPAAILVAAFQVHVGGPRQFGIVPEHGEMARPGVEPDVEDVVFFAELRRRRILRSRAGRHQFGGGALVPDVGGVLGEELDDAVEDLAIRDRLAAAFAVEDDDRNAPDALARDAPVGTVRDHVVRCAPRPRQETSSPCGWLRARAGGDRCDPCR